MGKDVVGEEVVDLVVTVYYTCKTCVAAFWINIGYQLVVLQWEGFRFHYSVYVCTIERIWGKEINPGMGIPYAPHPLSISSLLN